MKRVGTITIALSFVFFGVILLTRNFEAAIGDAIFNFWPTIFILLGIEILYVIRKYGDENKIKFNYLFILVVILFIVAEGIFTASTYIKTNHISFSDEWDIFDGKSVKNLDLQFPKEKEIIVIEGSNGNIKIEKSSNNEIRLNLKSYENMNSFADAHNDKIAVLETVIEGDKQIVDFNKFGYENVKGTIYIPENTSLVINLDNGEISSNGNLETIDVFISMDNGKIDLENFKATEIINHNGAITVKDTENVTISNDNGNINVQGNVENIKINSNLGAVSIDNNLVGTIDVSTDIGLINFSTKDSNFSIQATTKNGGIFVDGEKVISNEFRNKYGTAKGTVTLKSNLGAIKVND